MVFINGDFYWDDVVVLVFCCGVVCFVEFYDVDVVLIECGVYWWGRVGLVCYDL